MIFNLSTENAVDFDQNIYFVHMSFYEFWLYQNFRVPDSWQLHIRRPQVLAGQVAVWDRAAEGLCWAARVMGRASGQHGCTGAEQQYCGGRGAGAEQRYRGGRSAGTEQRYRGGRRG